MSGTFDYQTLAKRLAIEPDRLAALEACLRPQYGFDQMMFEMRMLRTVQAVADGTTTLEAAIQEFALSPLGSATETA